MPNIKSPAQALIKDVKISIPHGFGARSSDGSKIAVADKGKQITSSEDKRPTH